MVYNILNAVSSGRDPGNGTVWPGLVQASTVQFPTDIVLHLEMDTIPEPIRGKLVVGGYDSLNKLPNDKDVNRWNRVQARCDLDDPELDQLMNIRFPVQQGNVIIARNHPLIHSNYFFWFFLPFFSCDGTVGAFFSFRPDW